MPRFEFGIQSYITVDVEADDFDEARRIVCDNLDQYADKMMQHSCVCDGKEKEET